MHNTTQLLENILKCKVGKNVYISQSKLSKSYQPQQFKYTCQGLWFENTSPITTPNSIKTVQLAGKFSPVNNKAVTKPLRMAPHDKGLSFGDLSSPFQSTVWV